MAAKVRRSGVFRGTDNRVLRDAVVSVRIGFVSTWDAEALHWNRAFV
jgi:hypothetical protein